MSDDPDELRYEIEREKKDPVIQAQRLRELADQIEIHLRYGIPALKLIGWLIAVLLALILWRIW